MCRTERTKEKVVNSERWCWSCWLIDSRLQVRNMVLIRKPEALLLFWSAYSMCWWQLGCFVMHLVCLACSDGRSYCHMREPVMTIITALLSKLKSLLVSFYWGNTAKNNPAAQKESLSPTNETINKERTKERKLLCKLTTKSISLLVRIHWSIKENAAGWPCLRVINTPSVTTNYFKLVNHSEIQKLASY